MPESRYISAKSIRGSNLALPKGVNGTGMLIHLLHGKLAQSAGFEAIEIHMNNPLSTGGTCLIFRPSVGVNASPRRRVC